MREMDVLRRSALGKKEAQDLEGSSMKFENEK